MVPGAGLLTVTAAELDTPPPGPAFTAEIARVPGLPRSACVSATAKDVPLMYVVGRVAPLTNTAVPARNPVPPHRHCGTRRTDLNRGRVHCCHRRSWICDR